MVSCIEIECNNCLTPNHFSKESYCFLTLRNHWSAIEPIFQQSIFLSWNY
jgi:hypothetical protein